MIPARTSRPPNHSTMAAPSATVVFATAVSRPPQRAFSMSRSRSRPVWASTRPLSASSCTNALTITAPAIYSWRRPESADRSRRAECQGGVRDSGEQAPPARLFDEPIAEPAGLGLDPTALGILLHERLDDHRARDLLLEVPGERRALAPRRPPALAQARVQAQERGEVDRHGDEDDERELPVDEEDRDEHREHRDHVHE